MCDLIWRQEIRVNLSTTLNCEWDFKVQEISKKLHQNKHVSFPLSSVYSRAHYCHANWHKWAVHSILFCYSVWKAGLGQLLILTSRLVIQKSNLQAIYNCMYSKSVKTLHEVSVLLVKSSTALSVQLRMMQARNKSMHIFTTQIHAICIATNIAKSSHVPLAYSFCQHLGST